MAVSLEEYEKALNTLKESISLYQSAVLDSPEQLAFRDACIQRFEFCIELSWKLAMKQLGSPAAAAKPAVREMARNNLVSDSKLWLDFIEARNEASHSYDAKVAARVFSAIEKFMPEAFELLQQ